MLIADELNNQFKAFSINLIAKNRNGMTPFNFMYKINNWQKYVRLLGTLDTGWHFVLINCLDNLYKKQSR